MNRVSLAVERPNLRIVPRDEQAARIAEAVAKTSAMDARLSEQPGDPTSSPVQIGQTQKFTDPYREGRVSFVHRLLGGQEVIVIVPLKCDCDDVANAVDVLVDTVLAHVEPTEL